MTKSRFLAPLSLWLIACGTVTAQTNATWNGGDGNWGESAHWSSAPTIPNGVEFNVQIDGGKATDSIVHTGVNQDISLGSVSIDSGDSLWIDNGTTFSTITDLTLNPSSGSSSNAGKISVGGNFNLGGSAFDNAGGTIDVLDGGSLLVGIGTAVRGGTFRSSSSGSIELGRNSKIEDLTVDGVINEYVGSKSFHVAGAIDNRGTININGSDMRVDSDTRLTGGGTLNMGYYTSHPAYPGFVYATDFQGAPVKLTNVDNTIRGWGYIGGRGDSNFELVNEAAGTIETTKLGEYLRIGNRAGSTLINRGTIRAAGDFSTVDIFADEIDNTGGVIAAVGPQTPANELSTRVNIEANRISGGTFRTVGNAAVNGYVERIANVVVDARLNLRNKIVFETSIENRGTININADSSTVLIEAGSDVSLTGGGTVDFINLGVKFIGQSGAPSTLTNVDNTIQGGVLLGAENLTFRNQVGGTVRSGAATSMLAVFSADPEETNRGTFHAMQRSWFLVYGDFVNNGRIVTDAESVFYVEQEFTNSAIGSMVGNGKITATQMFINHGRIAPRETTLGAAGELIIDESTTFSDTAVLDIEIDADGGDMLTVFGNLLLDGELRISIQDGVIPLGTDIYQIVRVSDQDPEDGIVNTLSGQFVGIGEGQTVWTADGRGSFIVNYSNDGVFLSNFVAVVPEPSSTLVWAAMMILVAIPRRSARRTASATTCGLFS